uniref:methyl-accepting chemotaxis protein n=1 Tax=Lachnospira sp. TaxID=2049031 RepID=UPI003FED60EA
MNSGINPKEKDYELARENTVAMNCHFLVCGIISIAYFVEFLKGDRTLLYVLATIILAMGPVVGEIICYKKQHDTKMIKHFVGIGYAILYTFVMFTTNNHFTFVYVIPMLIAITVYNDFKYSLPIEVGVVIVNVIQLALFFKRGIYTKADMASVEIQFFVIVLICGIQLYVSIVAEKLNQKKLAELKAEHEKTEELLTRIMDTSDKMTQQITESAQKTASLGESMQAMKESMEEVNSGSNDTAEAVQSQLNQTEEIQAMVEQVEKGTENIIDSMNQNKEAIAQGNANVGILVKQAEETVESGKKVTEELSQLDTYMSQMNSILDIINSITSQTSLLALNASIEAARAGEAGRGFAVVASEISQMAQQTKDSTVQISQLIENVSNAIQMVVEVSGSMISMIESQNETTEKTAESFTVIEKNSDNVYGHSNELAAYVTKLADANKKIVDSISTISAISEEVAAHASDTLSATESNNVIVEELAALSGQLETLAQELKEQ